MYKACLHTLYTVCAWGRFSTRQRSSRREYTTLYCPEQNGIAERMNQTIQERVVSMLQHSVLSDVSNTNV